MRSMASIAIVWCCSASAHAVDLTLKAVDPNGAPVSDVVFALYSGSVLNNRDPAPDKVTVKQMNRQFRPHVTAVRRNQEITFPNEDDVLHHVYSFSPAKKFELELYGRDESPAIVFDQPGVVVLGCNIHDHMRGYIYVTDAPVTAVSDDSGTVGFSGLPNVTVRVEYWHPRVNGQIAQSKDIDLAGSTGQSELTVTINPSASLTVPLDRFEQGDYE